MTMKMKIITERVLIARGQAAVHGASFWRTAALRAAAREKFQCVFDGPVAVSTDMLRLGEPRSAKRTRRTAVREALNQIRCVSKRCGRRYCQHRGNGRRSFPAVRRGP